MAGPDKATAVTGADVGDAARRRNVAVTHPAAATFDKPEAEDKKKQPLKKVRAIRTTPNHVNGCDKLHTFQCH